ncbi:MAG: OB-fold domain-containing protein [Roseovarius sp.]|nr:OB-fold domain-containing protein [Roseovarius sp.]
MPEMQGPDKTFRDGLAKGQIHIQQCDDCERFIFFPRVLCPHCKGQSLTWRAASGDGTVYTTTTVRRKPERGGDYNICMVELAEGVRMMSRVDDISPDNVKIGQPVTAFVGEIDGVPAVLCKPAKG